MRACLRYEPMDLVERNPVDEASEQNVITWLITRA